MTDFLWVVIYATDAVQCFSMKDGKETSRTSSSFTADQEGNSCLRELQGCKLIDQNFKPYLAVYSR